MYVGKLKKVGKKKREGASLAVRCNLLSGSPHFSEQPAGIH